MRDLYRLAALVSILAAIWACRSESVPVPEETPQEATATCIPDVRSTADAVNEAARVMAEDQEETLEKIRYSFEAGKDSTHIYIEVTRGEDRYVSGELGLVQGPKRKELDVDLMVAGAIPVVGTVDFWHVGRYYAQACLSLTDKACQKNLDKANEGIHVLVMGLYTLELGVVRDEETNKRVIDLFLLDPTAPESARASLRDLLALFL